MLARNPSWVGCARIAAVLSFASVLALPRAGAATVMVVAPHPDDDVITSAGVIVRSLSRGEAVRVVYMTNGDVWGTSSGLVREDEAVAAQAQLGVAEHDLIFLGYPDTALGYLHDTYWRSTDVFNHNGQRTTYGDRGLGGTDYHTYRFGSPATYNGYNVTHDLADLLTLVRPDHVFVTSDWDVHSDHRATYQFVSEAIALVRMLDSTFDPVIHKTVVWSGYDGWPNTPDPTTTFAPVPTPPGSTLVWSQRESLDVPLPLQSTDLPANPKYAAIARHVSQGGNGDYIGRFVHKDEFFWPEQAGGNRPPVANAGADAGAARGVTVTLNGTGSFDPDGPTPAFRWRQASGPAVALVGANTATPTFVVPTSLTERAPATFELVVADASSSSVPDAVTVVLATDIQPPVNVARNASATASSQDTASGQVAAKAIDGVADGTPGDYTREWATTGEGVGAWIQLTWTRPQVVDRIVLVDRPNLDDWITAGQLSFGDGSTIAVGPLANGGSRVEVRFPARSIGWVRFTVTAVGPATVNVGLAEFEVWSASTTGGNLPPVAVVGPDQQVGPGATVVLHGEGSYDPEGAALQYTWTQTAGPAVSLAGATTATPSFTTPATLPSPVTFAFQLIVSDGTTSGSPAIAQVTAQAPTAGNIARTAAVTASSQNTSTGQLAVRAVDGYVDGYPGDYTREWATVGQQAGAWIELAWPSPQVVGRVVLHDRPNANDRVMAGTLTFGDGTSVTVGALDNTGAATVVDFAPRSISRVRFTVTATSATTGNVGLAEFEVWGEGGTVDFVPIAVAGADQTVAAGQQVQLRGDGSYDPGGQAISYRWTQTAGPAATLSSATAANPTFAAPTGLASDTTLVFELVVSDGTLASGPAVTRVTVQAAAPPPPPPSAPNLALASTATASSQNTTTGQLAASAIDGVIQGYSSGDYAREWATVNQGTGAWIQLTWPTLQLANSIVLYDRPNTSDRILAGTLTFSDGYSIAVGALDDAGGATPIAFSARYFLWVRFTVTQVSATTQNVGLAEFQVLGAPTTGNQPPVAVVAAGGTATAGQVVTLDGTASYDPEGATLAYRWIQVLGPAVVLSSTTVGRPTFTMPAGQDPLSFELAVSDGVSWSDPATVTVTPAPPPPPPNLARTAVATASSQNTTTGQLASSAIDGFTDGAPNGVATHEWATVNQRTGAWLQLDWTSPQRIGSVVLYDRPNSGDRVQGGVLEFGDGTTVSVGALANGGAGLTVTFTPRTVARLRFRVTKVSSTTQNVGLAEFEVLP